MKVYRYDSAKREDRKFNNTGVEKNPNNVQFYATNLKYADNYKYVTFEDGAVNYECTLTEKEIEANLFDMNANFETLTTFNNYVAIKFEERQKGNAQILRLCSSKKEFKKWTKIVAEFSIEDLKEELSSVLFNMDFQQLSDFETQNELVDELKALGFDGYKTINEVAIF